jgi:hypothetical protein
MMHLLLRGSVIVALALGLVGPAAAESLGIAGYSGEFGVDCNACHSGGTVPSVTITGPLQVPVGTIATYELKIVSGDLQQTHGGLDVSDTDGTLIATEAGTEILSGELVHSAPREQNASREVIFRFDWQAPAAPGQVTLYGAGNSVNNAQALLGARQGDGGADRELRDGLRDDREQRLLRPTGPGLELRLVRSRMQRRRCRHRLVQPRSRVLLLPDRREPPRRRRLLRPRRRRRPEE